MAPIATTAAAAATALAANSSRRKTTSKRPQPQHTSAATASSTTTAAVAGAAAEQGQYDAADAAMYKEMREALAEFEAQHNIASSTTSNSSSWSPREKPPPRYKAFYSALRSVLAQVLEEKTESSRHTRLLAAQQWYVRHKPRPKPSDMDMAAAMAASLSVTCPVTVSSSSSSSSAAAAAIGGGNESPGSSKLQQQQQFVVYGKPGQLFGEYQSQQQQQQQQQQCEGEASTGAYIRSRTARWQHQQQRLHTEVDAAAAASSLASATAAAVVQCIAEQPFMSQLPAMQDRVGSSSLMSSSGNSAAAGGAAADGLLSWSGGKFGSAAGATDGLIPLGSLPSTRFPFNSSSSSSGGGPRASQSHINSSSGSRDGYESSKAQWRLVAGAQQRIEASVAAQMQGYCRHRARLEEEISRKQEVSAQLAAASNKSNSVCNNGSNKSSNSARVLAHLDSQHQPSEVSAYQWAGGSLQQLVPANRMKEAKKKLLQESEREVAEVAEQLTSLGVAADPAVLEHALMPLPDQVYMVCLAHLPKPGVSYGMVNRRKAGAKEKRKTKKKSKGFKASKQAKH